MAVKVLRDFFRKRALKKRLLAEVLRSPGHLVQVPVNEPEIPAEERLLWSLAVQELLVENSWLDSVSCGHSVSLTRKAGLYSTLNPEAVDFLRGKGLAYSAEEARHLDGQFPDHSAPKGSGTDTEDSQ